jgi:predicted AlkP superfamily phosphohydrolase/phosphomutase
VAVIGLDCATPQLVFERWRAELPNLGGLIAEGVHGRLQSTVPPITVPAWMSMMTSRNPGRLGIYGFRNRADYSYDRMATATSRLVREDAVWDILGRAGRRVILVGVPPSYPPKPVNGCLVSCFMTPSRANGQFTHPPELRHEIETLVGRYLVDVEDFRTDDKDRVLRQIYEMTERRFAVVRHLMTTRPWDFLMMVEIGVDRIHHAFWKDMDAEHRKHPAGSPFRDAIRDYYRYVDAQVGAVLDRLDRDTVVLVVSDHGAKRMDGGICLNEWLRREGYLVLREEPRGIVPFEKAEVDWGRTVAWGGGGYYGRVFVNVKGREPSGVVAPEEYEAVRDDLARKIEAVPDEQGRPMSTRVFRPETTYGECRNIPPDLIVYFGDLYWRAVASLGHGGVHTLDNDTGPDDANHAEHGIFVLRDPAERFGREVTGLHLMDVGPTVLEVMGFPVPPEMEGRALAVGG